MIGWLHRLLGKRRAEPAASPDRSTDPGPAPVDDAGLEAAIDAARAAMERGEDHEALRERLGGLLGRQASQLQALGDPLAALERFEEALALFSAQAGTWNNYGNALREAGRRAEALEAYAQAARIDPRFGLARLNAGVARFEGGDREGAGAEFEAALQADPALAEAALNLGVLREQDGNAADAIRAYERAIEARPDFAEAHLNLAMQLLLTGEFERGWEEYEWRFRHPDLAALWPFRDLPRWNGGPLEGKSVLVYAEQGFGDALQFVRYLPLLAARGARVVLHCQPKLAALFGTVAGVAQVVPQDAPVPPVDLCCPMLSLPRLFGTRAESIPADVPYLAASEGAVAAWRTRLAREGAGRKVGLFWATDTRTSISEARSLLLAELSPLARVPGLTFFSLQRGEAAREAARPPEGLRLVDLSPELGGFDDDAALMASLDLVISINSATAHLAGALGRPVWTLVHYPPDWRWREQGDDSAWYPSMRLFRRGAGESWTDVVERVAAALGPR